MHEDAATGLANAEQRLGELGAAAAELSGDAEDLAGKHAERNVFKRARLAEAFHLQKRLLRVGGIAERLFGDALAGHVIDEVFLFKLVHVFVGDDLAIADHGDAVAHGEHFVQLVADKDHGHAALGKAADDLVKSFDLLVGQGGGGFIHDDEPGVLQDRPRDGDDLLLRDRQRADFCIQVQSDADGVQRLLRLYAGFAPMHSLAAFHQLHPQRCSRPP